MTRVFLADDHAIVRMGLKHLLSERDEFEVVGEAENGREVLNSEALAFTDVLVLDLSLPVVSGLEVLRRVRRERPSIGVVVHSMHPEAQFRRHALAAGAVRYVSKDSAPTALLEAIRIAADDPDARDPNSEPASVAPPSHTRLSRREHQVFLLLVSGRIVAEIAAELDIHSCTVSNHLARIKQKLGLSTVAELTRYAIVEGLVDPGPSPS